jgi:hypothetical protein
MQMSLIDPELPLPNGCFGEVVIPAATIDASGLRHFQSLRRLAMPRGS